MVDILHQITCLILGHVASEKQRNVGHYEKREFQDVGESPRRAGGIQKKAGSASEEGQRW